MVIHINPNRINTPASRPKVDRKRDETRESQQEAFVAKQPKVEENFIPEPESLATMIRSAVGALRQGIRWDRGTILNLLV